MAHKFIYFGVALSFVEVEYWKIVGSQKMEFISTSFTVQLILNWTFHKSPLEIYSHMTCYCVVLLLGYTTLYIIHYTR